MSPRFSFYEGPWENSTAPTIVRDDPEGGDPHIIATLARVQNPDALDELCRLANGADRDALIDAAKNAHAVLRSIYALGASRKLGTLYSHALQAAHRLNDALNGPSAATPGLGPVDKGHDWFLPPMIGHVCCRKCGVVRRLDGNNNPCRGPTRLSLRDEYTEGAP